MKKRVVLIFLFTLVGLVAIEVYSWQVPKENYAEMDYVLHYIKDDSFPKKLLMATSYFSYYFDHYDKDSYVEYEDGKTFSVMEAYNNRYLFLGDLMNEIDISKVYDFKLQVTINEKQDFARKLVANGYDIYYYKVNDIQVVSDTTENRNLLELLEEGTLAVSSVIEALEQFEELEEKKSEKYDIYTAKEYSILVDEKNKALYFGNKELNEHLVELKLKEDEKNE